MAHLRISNIRVAAVTMATAALLGGLTALPAQVASAQVAGAVTGKVTGPGTGSPNRLLQIVP